MDNVTERWLPVVDYEGMYEVSDLGRVWSVPRKDALGRHVGDRILKHGTHCHGYPMVTLWLDNHGTTRTVHSLIMEAFVGPLAEGMQVRHLDGDTSNSVLINLAYGTLSENMQDTLRHGTNDRANRTHCPQGHPYDAMNTRVTRRGNGQVFRQCRVCHLEASRRSAAKAKVGSIR